MTDKLLVQITAFLDANTRKNIANSEERKALQQAEKEFGGADEVKTYVISNTLDVEVGYIVDESEEIDPKKFMELYPEKFWDYVKIPITNVTQDMGPKAAAKCCVTVSKKSFKIKKVKKAPTVK
jgi:hypothetical protein